MNYIRIKALPILLLLMVNIVTESTHGQSYRQVIIEEFGDPTVLKVIEHLELPTPGPGEVRIKVEAASASFTDTMVRKGIYQGIDAELPYSPGYDLVGVIDQLGHGVTGFSEGQRVADLSIWGAYTEYAIRPIDYLVPVPDSVTSEMAVSVILTYTTAYQLMHRVAQVEPGQSILIHGASGAVGMALAQLGKNIGVQMYGTASTSNQELVSDLGVTPIDYKTEDFVERIKQLTNGAGVDVVFDAISIDNFVRSFKTLKPGGKLVAYGFYTNSAASQAGEALNLVKEYFQWLWFKLKSNWLPNAGRHTEFYSITAMRGAEPDWFKHDLAELFKLLESGKINPGIWATYPLVDAVKAHQAIEEGVVEGKIVLTMEAE